MVAKVAIFYTFFTLYIFLLILKIKYKYIVKMTTMTTPKSNFKVYNIESYAQSDAKFIQTQFVEFSKTKLKNLLTKNKNK